MSQFDIAQYADFRPPRYLCPRCASIWREDEYGRWPEGWTTTMEALQMLGFAGCVTCVLRQLASIQTQKNTSRGGTAHSNSPILPIISKC